MKSGIPFRALSALLLAGCIEQNPLSESPPAANSVALVPATLFLEPGATVAVEATEALSAGGALTWVSRANSIATVTPQGAITALAPGVTEIQASNPRGTGRTTVTVLPAVSPIQDWRIVHQGLTTATLLGVWSASPTVSFGVGVRGTIVRTEDGGATWVSMVPPDSTDLVGIWGSSPTDVYAVGAVGTVFHFDGASWSRMLTPTRTVLLDVFGFAPNDIYVVGFGASMHFDGNTWQLLSGVEGAELWALWGSDASHLFAAGQNGVIYRLQGTHWVRLASPTQLFLLGLWGAGPDDIYAVGIRGTVLHWDGVSWTKQSVPTSVDLFAIWGRNGAEILAVGDGGAMLLFNGSVWTLLPQKATGENLRAAHAAPSAGGNFVVAGWNGTALQRMGNGSWLLGASAPLLFDLARGPGGVRYAVGEGGAVLRSSGGGWSPLEVERTQDLFGAATDQGDLIVVGDAGTIRRFNGVGWSDESIAPRVLLRSIWLEESAQPGGSGFIVGDQGIVLRRLGGRWVEAPRVTDRFLRHVWGRTASDVYAVGDSGTVVHWNGSSWHGMETPTKALLRGVWGSGAQDVFAVGDKGTILRYDGSRWYAMPSPVTTDLRAVWGTGPTEVYVVGAVGVTLRFDGARWVRLSSPTTNFLLGFERRPGGSPTVFGEQGIVMEGER